MESRLPWSQIEVLKIGRCTGGKGTIVVAPSGWFARNSSLFPHHSLSVPKPGLSEGWFDLITRPARAKHRSPPASTDNHTTTMTRVSYGLSPPCISVFEGVPFACHPQWERMSYRSRGSQILLFLFISEYRLFSLFFFLIENKLLSSRGKQLLQFVNLFWSQLSFLESIVLFFRNCYLIVDFALVALFRNVTKPMLVLRVPWEPSIKGTMIVNDRRACCNNREHTRSRPHAMYSASSSCLPPRRVCLRVMDNEREWIWKNPCTIEKIACWPKHWVSFTIGKLISIGVEFSLLMIQLMIIHSIWLLLESHCHFLTIFIWIRTSEKNSMWVRYFCRSQVNAL